MLGKRLLDLIMVIVSLPLWLPLILLIAVLVRIRLGQPVWFCQRRSGLFGVPFDLVKFRSMTDERDAAGQLLPDAERLTPFGRFLRSSSLDELPELWNVLCGRMSLVGPRPLPVRYHGRYSARQRRRLEVPPGLTGWAQINGRNAISWAERLEMDVWYVDNRSLVLDLKILWLTVAAVLLRRGISSEGEATMREFSGDPQQDGTLGH